MLVYIKKYERMKNLITTYSLLVVLLVSDAIAKIELPDLTYGVEQVRV
jgi:hypothetical protein